MSEMPLRYSTGEEVLAGDKVKHFGSLGQVEFVADPSSPTPDTQWFIEEFGGGAMVKDREIGSVFIPAETMDDRDHLALVARQGAGPVG